MFQSFALLADSNDEPLAATINFILKAATHCQHLPEAVSNIFISTLVRYFARAAFLLLTYVFDAFYSSTVG